jgi:hypothetical protein
VSIGFRSSNSGKGTIQTNLTSNAPAGVSSGDVLVAFLFVNDNTVTITPPAGWTQRSADSAGSTAYGLSFTKVAGGGEPGSYTWTSSANVNYALAIGCYTGVSNDNPVDTFGDTPNVGPTTSISTPSTTPASGGNWLVCGYGVNANFVAFTPDGHQTEREAPSNNGAALELADENYGLTSASGTRTATSSASGPVIGLIVVLDPPGQIKPPLPVIVRSEDMIVYAE